MSLWLLLTLLTVADATRSKKQIGMVRLLNACYDCPPVALHVGHGGLDEHQLIRPTPYGTISRYAELQHHVTYEVKVKSNNGSKVLRDETYHLQPTPFTYAFFGSKGDIRTHWYADSWAYDSSTGAVRFIHIAEGSGPMDVKWTNPPTAEHKIEWQNVPYGSVGDYTTIPCTEKKQFFSIKNKTGDLVGVADEPSIQHEQAYTILFMGPPNDLLIKVVSDYNPEADTVLENEPEPEPAPKEVAAPAPAPEVVPRELSPWMKKLGLALLMALLLALLIALAQRLHFRHCYTHPLRYADLEAERAPLPLDPNRRLRYDEGGQPPVRR